MSSTSLKSPKSPSQSLSRQKLQKSGGKGPLKKLSSGIPVGPSESVPEKTLVWEGTELKGDKLSGRYGHTVIVKGSILYIFGGDGTSRINSVHKLDTETNTLQEVPTKGNRPSARSGNTAVAYGDCMFVFGGRDANQHYSDVYQLNLRNRRWTLVEPDNEETPPARYRHTCNVHQDRMFLFGGETGGDGGACYNDLYAFNFASSRWQRLATTGDVPAPRSAHSAVVYQEPGASGNAYLIVYGGRNADKSAYFSDMFKCNLSTYVWTRITNTSGDQPPATYDHAADCYRHSFYIWGGYGSEGDAGTGMGKRQDVLYEYSMEFNRWYLVETEGDAGALPSARLGHTLTVVRDKLYLLGGWDRNGYCSDLNVLKLDDYMLDIRSLLLDEAAADIHFHIGSRVIFANLPVVYARVPAMMEYINENVSRRVCHVTVTDAPYEAFYDFLMFVYTGGLQFSPKFMVDVWVLSKRYKLKRAMGLCILAISKNLNVRNALFILQSAHRANVAPVKAYCQQFVLREFEEVAHSDAMHELDKDLIVELVRLHTMHKISDTAAPRRLTDVNEFDVIPEEALKSDLVRLVGCAEYSDVNFSLDGQLIPAHTCIIRRCPAFRVMFSTAMLEGRTRIVELNDVREDVFIAFLRYVYGSHLAISNLNNALNLLVLADRFLLDPLKRLCGEYITARGSSTGLLNHNNVFQVLEIADQCRLIELKKVAVDYVARNFHAVCKSKHLKKFSQELLVEIIHRHASVCTTIEEAVTY